MSEAHALAGDLRVLEDEAGWLPLGGEGLVRVAGNGHRDALQRVLSKDILGLRAGEGALALLLAPKGQFRAVMAVFAGADQSYVLAPPGHGRVGLALVRRELAQPATRLVADGREFEVTRLPLC